MEAINSIDVPRWYAIQTKPKQESRAECNLRAWNVETFVPKIRERRFNLAFGKPTYVYGFRALRPYPGTFRR